jgi:Mrp family chromosome partitioning ATPase
MMGLSNEVGLSNLLCGELSALQAVQYSYSAKLPFIARGTTPASPAELLAGEAMADFFEEVRTNYDVVIIDGPPVLGLADAPRLAAAADGTLFVMEAHCASKETGRMALRRLVTSGANVIGLVLTKFDARKAGGGYGYAYTYEYGDTDQQDEFMDETGLPVPALDRWHTALPFWSIRNGTGRNPSRSRCSPCLPFSALRCCGSHRPFP